MQLREFVALIKDFDAQRQPERIKLFAWYLHNHRGVDRFDGATMRSCFDEIDAVPPDMSIYLPRLAQKRPPELLRDGRGYRLEGRIARALDAKYGQHPTTVAVTRILAELPSKVPDVAERAFLDEALGCYKVRAFRASIVMTWNLAFDHLLRWLMADASRLAQFNAAIPRKYPKRTTVVITTLDDFSDEFKESEVLEVLRTSGLVSKEMLKVLDEKLKRRNSAAHPSNLTITQHQADDVISDLVNNVVLPLR